MVNLKTLNVKSPTYVLLSEFKYLFILKLITVYGDAFYV